ncbi:ATP-binding protein [Comamonas sp. MYb69]|uniref:ATP-binding protein n=1 Tax=Comamonas sp. MYb69 TaxID=1848650 RepID=UPI0003955F6A
MARGLNRIWVRFGLWIAATLLTSIALLSACAWAFDALEYNQFYKSLPETVRVELDDLVERNMESSPRAMQIYGEYWRGEVFFGEQVSAVIALLICLPFGLAMGFFVSRYITRPLASMVEVAQRVAHGDFSSTRVVEEGAHGELKEVVHTFNAMLDALQKLKAERQASAASISHELRTPLSVLKTHLHALCDGVIAPSELEFRLLLAQTEHLGRLIDDLHTLAMAEAGEMSLRRERLSLGALVRASLQELQPQLQQAEMALSLLLPQDDALSTIRADPLRMRQIIANLVGNAVRHAASGHWLEVEVRNLRDAQGHIWIELLVSDAGPGLPQELRAHPFRRFAMAPGRRKREGSGLGLSIVQALTELQGGVAHAESSPRGGARFRLRFAPA